MLGPDFEHVHSRTRVYYVYYTMLGTGYKTNMEHTHTEQIIHLRCRPVAS